jgi:hypothetical protein
MHGNWAKSTQCYQEQDSCKGGLIHWACEPNMVPTRVLNPFKTIKD